MGNTPSTRLPSSSNRGFASTISSTFSKHKTDVEHSQSTTAVQFQKDLLAHQKEEEEYEYLTKLTTFDSHTLRLLKRRFDTIDQTIQKDGVISIEEFAKVLEMDCNSMLLRRFFKFMDTSSMGQLHFRNFATALSLLSIQAPDEDKIKLSFFLYDLNDDKKIDRDECTKMVKLALNEINMKLSNKQIEVIVNNTFNQADLNNDGVIDYQEYKIYCKKNPRVLQPFRMDIATLVLDEQENRRDRRVSQHKLLRHWPTDTKKKNKMLRKIKKSVPKSLKREKIERVRSIHNAQEILGLDDNKNDQYWDDETNPLQKLKVKKKNKKRKKNKNKNKNKKKNKNKNKKKQTSKSFDELNNNNNNNENNNENNNKKLSVSLERSNTDSTSESEIDDEHEQDDEHEHEQEQDDKYSIPNSPGSSQQLRFALSADSADRRRKKKQKYSKNNKNNIPDISNITETTSVGLNTSVPRTPPKSKEKPKIKQSDLDAIERLLN